MAWGTLYELTKLSDAAFKRAVSSGAIHPHMTRAQARTVRVKVKHRDVVISAPYYTPGYVEPATVVRPVYTADDNDPPMRLVTSATQPALTDPPPPDVIRLALAQIERIVGDLVTAVERGDVRRDAVFAGRIRAVTDRLLTLISDNERKTNN